MRLFKNQFVAAARLFVFDLLEGVIADLAHSWAHPERKCKLLSGIERAGVAEAQRRLAVQRNRAADHSGAERGIAVHCSPMPVTPRRIGQTTVQFVMRRNI